MERMKVCDRCGRYVQTEDWPCDVCFPYDPIAYNHNSISPLGIPPLAIDAVGPEATRSQAYVLRRGIAIVAALAEQAAVKARLTTDHPLSQAGRPVVMVDYQSYSSAEVLWVDGPPWARQAAVEAGYRVVPEAESTWPAGDAGWRLWAGWEEAEPREVSRT